VDVTTARAELGLGTAPTWTEVRVAYRAQIAASHPDRAGGDPTRAAIVTEAYAVLEQASREGRLAEPSPPPSTNPPPRPWVPAPPEPLDEPPEVLEGDTVHLACPADEAFARLLDACHRIGDVTYVDRSCAILEALVTVEGEGVCSLVITVQGRADGTDAFCTLEAIEHVATPPVRPVVDRLLLALRGRLVP
jgi:hypothetical protein